MELSEEVVYYKTGRNVLIDGLAELRRYVESDKFAAHDPSRHVNPDDISLRINEMCRALVDIPFNR